MNTDPGKVEQKFRNKGTWTIGFGIMASDLRYRKVHSQVGVLPTGLQTKSMHISDDRQPYIMYR